MSAVHSEALSRIPVRVEPKYAMVPRPVERRKWGTIARWARHRLKNVEAGVRGIVARRYDEGADADVPCGSCNACCRSGLHIDLQSWESDIGLDVEIREGMRLLRMNADGSCVHLVDNQCNVRDHRPISCRTYDCRDFAAARTRHNGPHVAPVNEVIGMWDPEFKSAEDQEVWTALGMLVIENFSKGMEPDAGFLIAILGYKAHLPAARKMINALKSDPGILATRNDPTITAEAFRQKVAEAIETISS